MKVQTQFKAKVAGAAQMQEVFSGREPGGPTLTARRALPL